jgi:DNA invertase Pin-like site-specific DNA recombinase
MDRLARNLDDLWRMVLGLTERGVHIVFVEENLTFTGEDSPMSNLLLSVMGTFADYAVLRITLSSRESSSASASVRELRTQKGKGSTSAESHRCHQLARPSHGGEPPMVAALAREFGISRDTLYRYVPVKKRRARKLAK